MKYTDDDFLDSQYLTQINLPYSFDSDRERDFTTKFLYPLLGHQWPLYTSAQMYIQTMGVSGPADPPFAGQRADFVVATANGDVVIELDGEEHQHHIEKDKQRDAFLKRNRYKVHRINNDLLDTNPEFVLRQLSNDIKKQKRYGDATSVTQKRIVAAKLIHQIQISITSGLIRSVLPMRCNLSVAGTIDGIDQNKLSYLLQLAITDLRLLFDQYCSLYGIEPFLEIGYTQIQPDCLICIGTPIITAPSTILIADISTNHRIENTIPSYSDLQIAKTDREVLKYFLDYVFHYDDFVEGQEESIDRLLKGKDSIVLLPTGSGKSLIYQLASLICPGKVIVISPLVSLMQDQVDNLFFKGIDCAISISRDNARALAELNNPGTVLIYISPERLQISGFRDCINSMQSSSRVFAVAVDEAHCVSEWGHDFRTAYLNIGRTSRNLFVRNSLPPTIIALTGTASTAVLKDIKRELEIHQYDAIITPSTFDRPELKYKVIRASSARKKEEIAELLTRAIPDFFHQNSTTFFKLNNSKTNCGIIFCPHVNGDYGVTKVQSYLYSTPAQTQIYAGSKPKGSFGDWEAAKRQAALDFKGNKVNTLIATKAFGMGIDKSNVRFTIHYGIPSSIESFYQEAGRAGRDRKDSICVLILSDDNKIDDDYMLNPMTALETVQQMIGDQKIDEKDDISRMTWFHVNSFVSAQ